MALTVIGATLLPRGPRSLAAYRRLIPLLAATTLLTLVTARSRPPAEGEFYSPWDLDGGCRIALAGEGHWIWVVYGAPWRRLSQNQAARMRALEQATGPQLSLFSVLTSGTEPLSIPRLADARAWAGTTAPPFERVLYDPLDNDTRTIPHHLLIGPNGRSHAQPRPTHRPEVDPAHPAVDSAVADRWALAAG